MRARMIVKMQRANEVPHLDGPDKMAVCGIDDDPKVLAVADPNVAGYRIHRRPMGAVEFPRSAIVTIPLIDEIAILIEVQYARDADLVGGIVRRNVVGALVPVTFEDINIVAARTEPDSHRLPEKPLSLGFIPISSVSLRSYGQQELALGTELLHDRPNLVEDPGVALSVDTHAMAPERHRLIGELPWDCEEHLVVRAKFKQGRNAGLVSLPDPVVVVGIDSNPRNVAAAWGQIKRV